jgi:hypothetical protein
MANTKHITVRQASIRDSIHVNIGLVNLESGTRGGIALSFPVPVPDHFW